MQEKLIKKTAERLMNIKGEARGVILKTDAKFVEGKTGEKGLERLEQWLKEMGYPIEYEKIETMDFYPIGLRVISLLAVREALGLSDDGVRKMGRHAPKISLVLKLFMKFFLSVEKTIEQVPEMWKKHYTIGELIAEADEEKRYARIELKGPMIHPVFYLYLEGYFSMVLQMVVNSPVFCEGTKRVSGEESYYEYLLKW